MKIILNKVERAILSRFQHRAQTYRCNGRLTWDTDNTPVDQQALKSLVDHGFLERYQTHSSGVCYDEYRYIPVARRP